MALFGGSVISIPIILFVVDYWETKKLDKYKLLLVILWICLMVYILSKEYNLN